MNWYKKQLMKIADSCISNKSDDMRSLSEILESDFDIHLSKNEIGDLFKNGSCSIEDINDKVSSNLSSSDKARLIDILNRYSQF